MCAGKISEVTGIPPSSLSFHLKELAHAGMASSRQAGRLSSMPHFTDERPDRISPRTAAAAIRVYRSVRLQTRHQKEVNMKRLHVHVAVDNLAQSIRFYSAMFAADPSVTKADYAKWMLDDPRVNFAISPRGADARLNHLGVQVESAEELAGMRAAAKTEDRPARREGYRLLLCQVGQVLGDRPPRHPLGDLSHAR